MELGDLLRVPSWPLTYGLDPKQSTQPRSFPGVCNCYHVYIRNYVHLEGPFQDLLKVGKQAGRKGSKVKINWCTDHDASFQALKDAVCGIRDLRCINPNIFFTFVVMPGM